jgi:hypothetical protein
VRRGWQLSHRSRRAVSRAHGRRVHREATETSATAVTAPLALGCESGGREAGDGALGLENLGHRADLWRHRDAPAKYGQTGPEGVARAYGGVGAVSRAEGSRLARTGPPRNSVPQIHLSFTKCVAPNVLGPATVLLPNSTMSVQQPGLHEPSRNKPFAPSPERAPAAPPRPKRKTCA